MNIFIPAASAIFDLFMCASLPEDPSFHFKTVSMSPAQYELNTIIPVLTNNTVNYMLAWTFCNKYVGLGRAAVCDCGIPWTFSLAFFPISTDVYIVVSK